MNEITTELNAFVDTRTSEEKQFDYTHGEVLAGSTPTWTAKTLVTLDERFQITSTSCIAQSCAKDLTKFSGEICSALPIFDSRSNFPNPAMFLQDGADISKNIGTDLESKFPSQNMTDEQLNAMKTAFNDMPFKISAYYTIPVGDSLNMDLFAEALDLGHALIMGIYSNADDWNYIPTLNNTSTFSHCVSCHSGNYVLYSNGKDIEKALGIDDSCNHYSSIKGQRLLTESFLRANCWGVIALVPSVPNSLPRPSYTFTVPLAYGLMNNPDVKVLQDILRYEGLFNLDSTGNYLQATKLAVKKFQEKYNNYILVPAGIMTGVGTGICGSHTIDYLNENYGVK